MPRARRDNAGMWLIENVLAVTNDVGLLTGGLENAGMGSDPHDRSQHERRETEGRLRLDGLLEPGAAGCVRGRIGPIGTHENVDVREDHRRLPSGAPSSMRSRSAALLASPTPARTRPERLETRGRRRCPVGLSWPAGSPSSSKRRASPSARRSDKVRPSRRARRLARSSRSSGKWMGSVSVLMAARWAQARSLSMPWYVGLRHAVPSLARNRGIAPSHHPAPSR